MASRLGKLGKRVAVLLAVSLVTLLAVRAWDSQRGLPLEPWHTFVPHELDAAQLDRADWAAYLAAEDAAFDAVRREVTDALDAEDRIPLNRYFAGSPIYPGRFSTDWNRSFVLEPEGKPVGAAVFLHGLTDVPYSMRSTAESYRAHGYLAIAIRLPGHGTVPGALTDVEWEQWAAATRLAVRAARRRIDPAAPLHLIGYSNGGALALHYALDALDDPALARPDRLVLLSPMIGVTAFARFAGLAGLPAIFPAFAKAAWLEILPEFNPFKYNSFPVNAARQSFLLTNVLQRQLARLASEGRLGELAPILTFQSVIDSTVSTSAIVSMLYARLPANGSELVLYDLNRSTRFDPLFRAGAATELGRLLPPPPRLYRTVILTNAEASADGDALIERVLEPQAATEHARALDLSYPKEVFSLSHIALPFPTSDPVYGLAPDPAEDFGIHLGATATRGERGALIVSLDTLLRMQSNPFFPYQIARIEEALGGATEPAAAETPESVRRP